MQITSELFGNQLTLPDDEPPRIVSLVSSATETLFAIGAGEDVEGVSRYCGRFVDDLPAPVVGDYLTPDVAALRHVDPDVVLVTAGAQRKVGRMLLDRGFPVYGLPLPNSLHGICDNIVLLGGLVDRVPAARELAQRLQDEAADLRRDAPRQRPAVYAELWFGRFVRTTGGLSFIHDLLVTAGGDPVFAADRRAYPIPDLDHVERVRPQFLLFHDEPEHPINPLELVVERGWDRWSPPPKVIKGSVERGFNLIHDGPSWIETARWLRRNFPG